MCSPSLGARRVDARAEAADCLRVLCDDDAVVALALLREDAPLVPPPGKELLMPRHLPQLPDWCCATLLLCLRSRVPAIQSEGIAMR